MPVVSVVVPSYNAEKYILQTLECLKEQTLSDIEVIVVNDGSVDNTAVIVEDFCKNDDRFSLINQTNSGVSSARNTGLHRANGRYILFLDSDDLLTAESLEAFAEVLDKTGADVAIGRLQSFGEVEEKYNGFAESLSKCENIDKFNKTLLWNFLVGNKCYRLKTLSDSGIEFPHIGYSEEGAFFMEYVLSDKVKKITGTDRACMKYRRHDPSKDASVSQSVTVKLITDFLSAIERIYKAAEMALRKESEEKREDYLQEILYKGDYVLISQFYRLIWQTDDEMLKIIEKGHKSFEERMTKSSLERIERLNTDIGEIVFDRNKVANNPKISVIADGSVCAETVNSVYMQSMPLFELFVKKSFYESSDFPIRWKECPNLHVLDDKHFRKNAKAKAKADKILKLYKSHKADPRMFRFLIRAGIPEKIKNTFFTLLFKTAECAVRIKQNG